MNTTIMASFDSIDGAAGAASDIRRRCDKIKSIKIKSHSIKTENESLNLWGAGALFANQPGFPYMQNTGLLPTPMAIPIFESPHSNEFQNVQHATLEVVTPDSTVREVCATIRQDGGVGVKSFLGERY